MDIMTSGHYLAAFMVGLLGGMHCMGMCGGIMGALSFAVPKDQPVKRFQILLSYNIGRILSYGLIGLLAGFLGYHLSGGHGLSVLRVIAGLLLVSMGLYLANWWKGLTYLEQLGGYLWRFLQPVGKQFMPADSVHKALILGAVWGWLPCGLVYTALVYAMAQAEPLSSLGVMLAFGIGTLPMVLVSGYFAEQLKVWLMKRSLRNFMAIMIIVFGFWTIWVTLQHTHMGHGDMNSTDEPSHQSLHKHH